MKTVYLIRHGQTEANTGGPYFGDRDKLTTEGRAQAGKVAERCTKLPLEVILSSTMDRAVETAAIIANACGISHESFDEFKESREPASLHGRRKGDAAQHARFKEWADTLITAGTRFEDGENFEDISARAGKALDLLAARPETEILVVSHGFFSRVMLARVLFGASLTAMELKRIMERIPRTENTHISIFHYDENSAAAPWSMWVWNDHAHLA